jgi:hypothetical protein
MTSLLLFFACISPKEEPCVLNTDFERLAGLPLPARALGLECYTESGIDTAVLAHFTMPTSDVDSYYPSLGLSAPLAPGQNPLRHEKAWPPPWWRATAQGTFRGAEGQVGNRAIKIRVEEEVGEAQVWLLTFTL